MLEKVLKTYTKIFTSINYIKFVILLSPYSSRLPVHITRLRSPKRSESLISLIQHYHNNVIPTTQMTKGNNSLIIQPRDFIHRQFVVNTNSVCRLSAFAYTHSEGLGTFK